MGRKLGFAAAAAVALGGNLALGGAAEARDVGGVACANPPPARCEGEACAAPGGALAVAGNATDAKTGRQFFLDYPCDLKPNEKVVFVLNLHGAGSFANWQRHYFPAADYKDKYRLVVATPTAATSVAMAPGGPGVRRWDGAADDAHLQNVTDFVLDAFGRKNIKSMWLAGHSQGGMTSRRIVCTDYFKDKVDGFISLSGGRIGAAPFVARFGPPKADGTPPDPRPAAANAAMRADPQPTCDFSHIFTVGQYEIDSLPDASPLADRFGCGPRIRRDDIVDEKPGHVWDYARSGYNVWGTKARPGRAEHYDYPKCRDGRVIADVVRMDKGHTEGLEPRVTEAIVKLMAGASGGKVAKTAP